MGFLSILAALAPAAGNVLSGAATLYATGKQVEATERINKLNLQLMERERKDRLEQQKIQNAFTERRFQRSEEQTGYNRIQNAANKFTEWLNSSENLQRSRLQPLMGR